MAGIRNTTAHRIDDDVSTLLAHLHDYFLLENQGAGDQDIRALFLRWFIGRLINLDETTARAVRATNLLSPGPEWSASTLVSIDARAGA